MPNSMIDWESANWLAGRVASRSENRWPTVDLKPIVDDAAGRVAAYTGLTPMTALPPAEGIGRREWVRSNISSARLLLDPVIEQATKRLTNGKSKPGLGVELTTSAEIGIVFGYMAKRVLGQFEFPMTPAADSQQRPRLLFVLPNLADAIVKLRADEREFITWVALHEVTHAVQFTGVSWLRDYLATNVAVLLDAAQQRMERKGLHLPDRAELARVGRAALKLDIYGMVSKPTERAAFDRMQNVMAVIEGHAEHVMDAVAPELLPSLPALRAGLDERRRQQKPLAKLIGKLLGMEMKMRQYEEGKKFWDAIVAARGHEALTAVFASPEQLPDANELKRPELWLTRTA